MKITLSENGPSMFFIGDPKNPVLSLNICNKGPIDIEFRALEDNYQKQILDAIKKGIITTDALFEELEYIWATKDIKKLEAKQEIKDYLERNKQIQATQAIVRQQREFEKREKEIREKIKFALTCSFNAIRNSLKDEKDMRIIRIYREMEQKGRNREHIVGFFNRKLAQLYRVMHHKIAREQKLEDIAKEKALAKKERERLRKEAKEEKEREKDRIKKEKLNEAKTNDYSVIESEIRQVSIKTEDLIRYGSQYFFFTGGK